MPAGRNALAALGVIAALGLLVAAPAAVDAALPDDGPVPAGDRLEVGYGVSVRPPPGARQDLGASRPGTGDVVLKVDGLEVTLHAVEVRERPADFVAHARRKFARDEGLRVGPPAPVRTEDGVTGQRSDLAVEDSAFAADPGCAAIFTGEWAGVVVVVSPARGCAAVPEPVWAAVRSLRFGPVESW